MSYNLPMKSIKKIKKKLIGEIVAGLVIVAGGVLLAFNSVQDWPNNAFAMVIAVPVVIVGLIILLSKDATKTGDQITGIIGRIFTN